MLDEPLLVVLLTLLAAATQGFLGFGYGIIAMSTLTLSHDLVQVSGFVNLTAVLLSVTMLARDFRRVLWPLVARIVPTMVLGLAVGLAALRGLDRSLMVDLLGAAIVAVSLWNLAAPRLRQRESRALDMLVGAISGVLSGAFNTGGPPLVVHLYRRHEHPIELVVTLQAVFVVSAVARAVMATSQGLIDGEVARDALLLGMPTVLVGVLLGGTLARRSSPQRFRRAAWIALGALGVALLASGRT